MKKTIKNHKTPNNHGFSITRFFLPTLPERLTFMLRKRKYKEADFKTVLWIHLIFADPD
jgi:hypothetical protein